jgi:hypothetical protein
VSGYVVVSDETERDTTASKGLFVACPEGLSVIGGGYDTLGVAPEGVLAVTSAPIVDIGGWRVTVAAASEAPEAWSLRVYAICIAAAPASSAP